MPRKSQKLTRRLGAGANPSTSTTSISTAGDFDYSGEFGLCTSLEDCTRKLIVTLGIDTGVFQNAQGQMTSILSGIFGKALKLLGLSVSDIREKVYEQMKKVGFRPAAIGRLQSSSGGAVLFLEI